MNEDDDAYLKAYNEKRPAADQLSEDDFEEKDVVARHIPAKLRESLTVAT